jgi:hypothetical protein
MCDRSALAADAARDAAKIKARKPAEQRLSEGQSGSAPAPKRTSDAPLSHGEAIGIEPSVHQEQ